MNISHAYSNLIEAAATANDAFTTEADDALAFAALDYVATVCGQSDAKRPARWKEVWSRTIFKDIPL